MIAVEFYYIKNNIKQNGESNISNIKSTKYFSLKKNCYSGVLEVADYESYPIF